MGLTYGSVCSGIEAASMAWSPLGWAPAFFSEIEKFPSAVLAHHYGSNMPGETPSANGIPNYGDMTKFQEWPDHAIDLLVGGTPCQSFSIAGLRKGLADPRGNLMLTYLAIARRYQPRWLVWENVPGVLSSNGGRDFGALIRGLEECGYHAAWRVLDAQYVRVDGFGRAVPQRRRRVFVVGYLGDWRRAAAVFLERESLRGDSAPSRQAREAVAPTISARPTGGGGLGTDFDLDGGLISSTGSVAHCLNAGAMGRIDYESETMIAHALRGEGFDASEDGTGRGTPIVPIAIQERAISENAAAGPDGVGVRQDGAAYTLEARQVPQAVAFEATHDVAGTMMSYAKSGGDSNRIDNAAAGYMAVATQGWTVRRLTPTECERLQGFQDGYTNIPWRGKQTAPDGPRYKALGNSMAVNCMSWIGRRIEMVEALSAEIDRSAAA